MKAANGERNGSHSKRGLSQFTAVVGDIEAGVKQRQASRSNSRQQRIGRKRRSTVRCFIGCVVILSLLAWFFMVREVAETHEPTNSPGKTTVDGKLVRKPPNSKLPPQPPGRPKQRYLPSGVPVVPDTPIPSGKADDELGPLVRRLFELGAEKPALLADAFERDDPFGINVNSPEDFKCPKGPEERLIPTDLRNTTAEALFRAGTGFAYFQHLRKAGGTAFCDLAQRNMPRMSVPRYFCMPDNRGSMATPPWGNATHLLEQLKAKGHRLTSNEWDALPATHTNLPGAVYATSMRHPVDRWYSQYRFEHLEKRDGTKGDRRFGEWYKRSMPYNMGHNYYVKTFCGAPNPPAEELRKDLNRFGNVRYEKDLYWSYHKFSHWGPGVPWEQFKAALKMLMKFDVVLVLEWLDDSDEMLDEQLGWKQGPRLVLPHEKQHNRGRDKTSIKSKEAMTYAEWTSAASNNAFDILLYNWGKRLFLERWCMTKEARALKGLPARASRRLLAV